MKQSADYYRFFGFTWVKFGLLASNLLLASFEGFLLAEILRRLLGYLLARNFSGVWGTFWIIVGLSVLYLICHFFEMYIEFMFRRKMECSLQDELFEQYLNSQDWSEGFISEVLAQMRMTVPTFAATTVTLFRTTIKQIALMAFSSAYVLSVSPLILISAATMCVLFLLLLRRSMNRTTQQSREYMQDNDHVYALLKEQVKNRDIAAYMNNERVTGELAHAEKRMLNTALRLKKISNLSGLSSVSCSLFLFLISSVLGGGLVLDGRMTAESLVSVLLVIPNLSSGMFSIPGLLSKRKEYLGQRQHYEDFLSSGHFAEPCTERWNPRDRVEDRFAAITLCDLNYEVPGGKRILDSVCAQFPCGRFLCLAGASGCGKTTLLNILGRQYSYDAVKNAVMLGNRALSGINRDDYWKQLLYIHNRQEIFNRSIAYNIALSKGNADEKRLREAIRLADLEEWFDKSGGDFQTVLKREQLSSGERQKFAMARFFYRDCLGGFFDEITSAMDAESEKRIIENLKEWVKQDERRFVLFVSHRYQPLAMADCIYYMEDKRIAAKGTHGELKASCPGYRKLLKKEA